MLLFFRLIYQIYKKMTNGKGSLLTNSKPFKMMVSSTFKGMDSTGSGEVTKDELYAGLLLIHLKLSKFVGAPACYVSRKWMLLSLIGGLVESFASSLACDFSIF